MPRVRRGGFACVRVWLLEMDGTRVISWRLRDVAGSPAWHDLVASANKCHAVKRVIIPKGNLRQKNGRGNATCAMKQCQ